MTVEQYKIFIRYLKERGLYFAFLNDAKRFPERRKGKHVKTALLNMSNPREAIMVLINWGFAEYKKWQDEYHKYINFYNQYQLDKITKDNSYEIFKKVKKLSFWEKL